MSTRNIISSWCIRNTIQRIYCCTIQRIHWHVGIADIYLCLSKHFLINGVLNNRTVYISISWKRETLKNFSVCLNFTVSYSVNICLLNSECIHPADKCLKHNFNLQFFVPFSCVSPRRKRWFVTQWANVLSIICHFCHGFVRNLFTFASGDL